MSKHFCMLAHKYDPKRIKEWPVAVEPKLDGVRVVVFVRDGAALFFSRSAKPFPALSHLEPAVVTACKRAFGEPDAGVVLDCEAVSGTFNVTVSSVRRKHAPALDATLYVFDALFGAEYLGKMRCSAYYERRARLGRLIGINAALDVLPVSYAEDHYEVHGAYRAFREQGYEGAMVKQLSGLYERKRSHAWMKIKAEESVDVPVIGRFEGEGKHAGRLGGLVVNHDGVEVRVGTGFTDEQRRELWECKFTHLRNRLVEVQYHEETPDGSLRHPRFIRFRDALTGAKE